MATLRLAKGVERDLCPFHELRALQGEPLSHDECEEGVCTIRTNERVTREALTAISRATADAYEAMLLSGDSGSGKTTLLGKPTAMVLAIAGLAEVALKRISR
jgi:hypothetical protein